MTSPNQGPPQGEMPPLTSFYAEKVFWMRHLMDTDQPPETVSGRAAVANITAVNLNLKEANEPGSHGYEYIRNYLEGPPTDVFDMYEHGERIVAALTENALLPGRNVQDPDVVDLMVIAHASTQLLTTVRTSMQRGESELAVERARAMQTPIFLAALRRVRFREGDFDIIQSYRTVYENALGEFALPAWQALDVLRGLLTDRLILGNIISQGNWSLVDYHEGERNAYNRPLNEEGRHELNTQAAEVIERLHLLKAYPVMSFEVKGEQLGLPWDVTVVPPATNIEGDYAEGAVADFMFIPPELERHGTGFEYVRVEDDLEYYKVTVGGATPIMRFRLHDDGQITFGSQFHNVPNNDIEHYFQELGAEDAFVKLRGLFIALAFDAVVPDEAVPDAQLRGSVGRALVRPGEQEPPQHRFTQLLLRRRRALERTGIGPNQRRPQGWPAPPRTQGVRGYFLPLRENYRPRPDAEQDAIAWHRAHNIPYPGWREGHTWTRPYKRAGSSEAVYRRASFRDTSETMRHIGAALGIRRKRERGGRRRP